MRTKDQEKSEEQDLLTSSYRCCVMSQFIISVNPPGYINTLQTSGYWRLSRPWRHWPSSYRPPADQLHNIHTLIFCTASASLSEAALPQIRDPAMRQHFAMKSQSPTKPMVWIWANVAGEALSPGERNNHKSMYRPTSEWEVSSGSCKHEASGY